MRKTWTLALVSVFVGLGLLMSSLGCSPQAPAPTSKPTSAQTSAPAPVVETFAMKYATFVANADYYFYKGAQGIFNTTVEKRSGGRIKITPYFANALVPVKGILDAVRSGSADIGYITTADAPGTFPLASIIELPLGAPNDTTGTIAAWKLYKKGYFDKEFADFKVIQLWYVPPSILISKKPISSTAELKGLRARSSGIWAGKTSEALGITAEAIPIGETYAAMQKGIIDGVISHAGALHGYKLEEIGKYVAVLNFGTALGTTVMNKRTWEKLPQDLKNMIDEQIERQLLMDQCESTDANALLAWDAFEKAGVKVWRPEGAELQKIQQAAAPLWSAWVKEVGKSDPRAETVAKEWKAIMSTMFAYYAVPY